MRVVQIFVEDYDTHGRRTVYAMDPVIYNVKLVYENGTQVYTAMSREGIIRLGQKSSLCAGLRFLTECQ